MERSTEKREVGNRCQITNCIIMGRSDDTPGLNIDEGGHMIYRFNNYAIIPREEYDRLIEIERRMKGSRK